MENPKPFFHNSEEKSKGCIAEGTLNAGILLLSILLLILSLATAIMTKDPARAVMSDSRSDNWLWQTESISYIELPIKENERIIDSRAENQY